MSDQRSPWPVAVACTLPIAEAGIVFGSLPLASVGLVGFAVACVAGLRDAGTVTRRHRAYIVVTGALAALAVGFALLDPHVPVDLGDRTTAGAVAASVVGGLAVGTAVLDGRATEETEE